MSKYQQSRAFIGKLGLKYPIIQSPMAGISTLKMASVVSETGGLGSIPFGSVDFRNGIDGIVRQLDEFKALTNTNVVNLNFFCHDFKQQNKPTAGESENWGKLYKKVIPTVDQDIATLENGNVSLSEIEHKHPDIFAQLLETLINFKPKVVSFHFGYPTPKTIKHLQDNGILVFVAVTSVEEANELIALNVNGLIGQGYEAGGHRGNFLVEETLDENLSTFSLFEQLKSLVEKKSANVFIIPAGGIMNGADIEYYLRNGASAVQLGTAFLTAPESNSNNFIKLEVLGSNSTSTIMTSIVSGKPARCLRTSFIEGLVQNYHESKLYDQPSYGYAYFGYKKLLGILKDPNCGFYLAGQNYHKIKPDLNTKQILLDLIQELEKNGFSSKL